MEGTIVTGVRLEGSVLTVTQNNGLEDINVDLSILDESVVNGGSYDSGVLTLNVEDGSNIQIPLQTLVNLIANRVSFDTNTNEMTFSSDGGGELFKINLSSLKDNKDNLVASGATADEVDVVTEEELTRGINTEFSSHLDSRLNTLI